jgi:hypothetical protein
MFSASPSSPTCSCSGDASVRPRDAVLVRALLVRVEEVAVPIRLVVDRDSLVRRRDHAVAQDLCGVSRVYSRIHEN